jgi:D-amino-acid dehydrogenase
VQGLWVNAGHGTLGWTHGAGSGRAMAELISGRTPRMNFRFYGFDAPKGGFADSELALDA